MTTRARQISGGQGHPRQTSARVERKHALVHVSPAPACVAVCHGSFISMAQIQERMAVAKLGEAFVRALPDRPQQLHGLPTVGDRKLVVALPKRDHREQRAIKPFAGSRVVRRVQLQTLFASLLRPRIIAETEHNPAKVATGERLGAPIADDARERQVLLEVAARTPVGVWTRTMSPLHGELHQMEMSPICWRA